MLIILLPVFLFVGGWWYFSGGGRGDGGSVPSDGYQPVDGADGTTTDESDMDAAYDSKRKADLSMIRAALEIYRTENETYPSALSDLQGEYLSTIPQDPDTNSVYTYTRLGSNSYTLSATLSDGSTYAVGPQ